MGEKPQMKVKLFRYETNQIRTNRKRHVKRVNKQVLRLLDILNIRSRRWSLRVSREKTDTTSVSDRSSLYLEECVQIF